jgi:hypothetical protein
MPPRRMPLQTHLHKRAELPDHRPGRLQTHLHKRAELPDHRPGKLKPLLSPQLLKSQSPVMENEWVVIAGFSDDVRSQIAVERLLSNGIDAVAVDKRDRIYKIGEIEIFVHRDNVIIAKEIIKDL